MATITSAALTDEQRDRLGQGRVLREPRVRALWPQLTTREQRLVLGPEKAVGHRYPLTSTEIAELTSLSQRQVRYWADHGLLPHWQKGNRRLFEAVGLIMAFSLARANQQELQFYRSVLGDSRERLTAKVGILASLLTARLANDPAEAERLVAPLEVLTQK